MALTSINAAGWSSTYTSPPAEFDPVGSPVTFSATRDGFDSTGTAASVVDTLVVTKRIRQAYPSQASLTSDQAALSDYVYATDVISGVTNNATEVSPKPIGNWVMPHRGVVGNSLFLEAVFFHRNARNGKEVAAVKFIATDGTNTVSQTVSATVVSNRTGDRNAVVTYQCNLDITTLNPGLIVANAEGYPHVGVSGSVLKSADSSVAREFSPRYFHKDVTLAANPIYAYVATGGNDTTGAVSSTAATAAASPCLTVLGAINRIVAVNGKVDGCVIRVGNDGGTPWVLTSTATTRTQNIGCLTITRDPNVARANARVSFGTAAFRPRLGGSLTSPLTTGSLRFTDVSIVRTGTLQFTGEAATQLEVIFDDVDFNNGSNNASWLANAHDYHYGTTFTSLTGNSALGAGTLEHRCLRGITVDLNFGNWEGWLVVGSTITRPGPNGYGVRTDSGSILCFNKFVNPTTSAVLIEIGATTAVTGFAFCQNVVEFTSATTAAVVRISGDAATGNNTHVILHSNTFVGAWQAGRCNIFYDEGATRRTSKLQSVVGNIGVAFYTKSDIFRGANEGGGDASSATGNWAFMHGAGCFGNFTQYMSNDAVGSLGGQSQDYAGLGTVNGTSQSVRNDPLFTSNQGTTYNGTTYTAGAGGGDYTLSSSSPAKAIVPSGVLAFDLAGVARASTSETAGAYTIVVAASSSSGRNLLMGVG